jgi:hypothetical protein
MNLGISCEWTRYRELNNLWLIRGSGSVQNADEFKIGFLKYDTYYAPQEQKQAASLP